MKTKQLKILLLVVLVVSFGAAPCLAKAKGYFYVVAYSFDEKVVYYSPIFVEKVKDTSYSNEEFVTDVELLQKIESAFSDYMAKIVRGKLFRYTMTSRGAYKSYAIAKNRQETELKAYDNKGLKIEYAETFKFSQ